MLTERFHPAVRVKAVKKIISFSVLDLISLLGMIEVFLYRKISGLNTDSFIKKTQPPGNPDVNQCIPVGPKLYYWHVNTDWGSNMKKMFYAFILFLLSWGLFSTVHAGPKVRLDPTTNTCRKFQVYNDFMSEAYILFVERCQVCHSSSNDQGAPFLHSESKTSEAWNRVFFERYPQCAIDGAWDDIELQDLLKINDFLYRFAAGTYDPNDAEDANC